VTLAARLAGKTAAETIPDMLAVFARVDPALRKSITFDNDTAFAQHALLRTMRAMTAVRNGLLRLMHTRTVATRPGLAIGVATGCFLCRPRVAAEFRAKATQLIMVAVELGLGVRCNASRRLTLGDTPDSFDKTLSEITSLNAQAKAAGALSVAVPRPALLVEQLRASRSSMRMTAIQDCCRF
jgi:hypothetical protein